jgi:nitrate reductase alpha subunit
MRGVAIAECSAGMSDQSRPSNPLLTAHRFFRQGPVSKEGWSQSVAKDRRWESFYRDRWQHDKVVRSTHGVNCTGSCSWNVYVKEGIITWETQAVDYPSTGPDMPDHEPRGCPRGASFSWYTYSPLRVKYPYVRGSLLEMYRRERAAHDDAVEAWAAIVDDPERARTYKSQRGKGGFVRASWEEVAELIAAAHVHTIEKYGPDRVAGFSPIPAMSMASYSAGTRFLSLIGGVVLSFYDWYADLPPASPQVFGDQTDVPESADWFNSSYLIIWGTNLPITRTPDAHFMTEARYKGQKVVVVSPDYSDHTKFADHWLPAQPGTDAALAMAMGHVILKEFYVDRQVPYFQDYAKKFTDLPFLVTLRERDGAYVADRFLRASDLAGEPAVENAAWKTVVVDSGSGRPVAPNGSIGFRYGDTLGRWNLELGDVDPLLTLHGRQDQLLPVDLPRFDEGATEGGAVHRRGVPALRVGGHLVTTVFDLLLAQYGVAREGLPGEWPQDYADPQPYTPAWQEPITSVDGHLAARIAREFARNAELTHGRSMICMGAGTNHWFHSDQVYRTFLTLLILCGCEGVNGGGWAHYVGQEKVRPLTGWQTLAFALDWVRPPRQQAGTPYWYLATDQWRYDTFTAEELASPLGRGIFESRHMADCNAQAARLGWMPSFPTFNRNPLELVDEASRLGVTPADHVVDELRRNRLAFAAEDPDAPENWPRVLTVWRANLLGSSGKGHEYFLKHLLGTTDSAVRAEESPSEARPREVRWRDSAPEGKLDLLTTIDFRMTSNCLFSDVVLPAATWYEKYDLSSTDMHPFVHAFNQAIPPPWEAKTDWDAFNLVAAAFSRLAATRLGVRKDLVAAPLQHDTADEIAQPFGQVRDWKAGEAEPAPGRTMPKLIVVERDYGAVAARMKAIGPLVEQLGNTVKGASWKPLEELEFLAHKHGRVHGGPADGRPAIERPEQACEMILALSGTTNGRLATEGFRSLEPRTGLKLVDLAEPRGNDRITFHDTQVQPRTVITSPEWSGIEAHGRRYAPFTMNVEKSKPWHTLSGRQHFYLDHEWMLELGEGLPTYRPPLSYRRHYGEQGLKEKDRLEVTLRYLTPHSKWSIHSEYQDNLHMLTLFRGGPVIWLSQEDAVGIGVKDNDWIEAYNRNGVIACRAVVSHRLPQGTCLMYHAKDRHVNVPLTELQGNRGGMDNSLTRIVFKPTHLIGGYAQLSYAFNYYGPCGSQRDEITVIRKRKSEVVY